MKILISLSIMLSCLMTTACAVHTREGSIVVDPEGRYSDGHYGGGNRGFCPPGQAKKGNC